MTTTKPMPCPFCDYPDNGAPVPTRVLAGIELSAVLCNGCGCCGPEGQTPEQAIAAWNKAGAPLELFRRFFDDYENALEWAIASHDSGGPWISNNIYEEVRAYYRPLPAPPPDPAPKQSIADPHFVAGWDIGVDGIDTGGRDAINITPPDSGE